MLPPEATGEHLLFKYISHTNLFLANQGFSPLLALFEFWFSENQSARILSFCGFNFCIVLSALPLKMFTRVFPLWCGLSWHCVWLMIVSHSFKSFWGHTLAGNMRDTRRQRTQAVPSLRNDNQMRNCYFHFFSIQTSFSFLKILKSIILLHFVPSDELLFEEVTKSLQDFCVCGSNLKRSP